MRKNIFSGSKWEPLVAYSRAVCIGNFIAVAGTTAVDQSGEIVGPGDPYQQTSFALAKIEKALNEAGASLKDVIRTRIFATDISHWEQIGKAHREFFEGIFPACTMVEVSRLVDKDMLVEIEVEAIMTDVAKSGWFRG